ncbi:MAG: DNA mismatch repair protein MutT [Arcobacter sp.]|nr:MAG: DNA mismatch repair protein MutT [Arcobacter sp.]
MQNDALQYKTFFLKEDKYNGFTLDNKKIICDKKDFKKNIEELIFTLTKEKRKLLWIPLDIEQSSYIPILTKLGFTFHTCEKNKILLVKELIQNSIIPTASNHTLGVGVVVFNDKNEVLLVKEKYSNMGFKLPGGHIDDGELITSAVSREVKEETGIDVVFESIVSLGHFFPHQFNQSNLYILCIAKALSSEINIQDTHEILECKWIDIKRYINDEDAFAYNKEIVKIALKQKGLKQKEFDSFRNTLKNYELFF